MARPLTKFDSLTLCVLVSRRLQLQRSHRCQTLLTAPRSGQNPGEVIDGRALRNGVVEGRERMVDLDLHRSPEEVAQLGCPRDRPLPRECTVPKTYVGSIIQ